VDNEITREELVEALVKTTPETWQCDEVNHRGVGQSIVSWWSVGDLYVWRVRFHRSHVAGWVFVDGGVARTTDEARCTGHRAARENAKRIRDAA
jgi:hypothetical protein